MFAFNVGDECGYLLVRNWLFFERSFSNLRFFQRSEVVLKSILFICFWCSFLRCLGRPVSTRASMPTGVQYCLLNVVVIFTGKALFAKVLLKIALLFLFKSLLFICLWCFFFRCLRRPVSNCASIETGVQHCLLNIGVIVTGKILFA